MLVDRLKTSAVLIAITALLLWLDANRSFSGAEGLFLLPLLLFFALGTAWDLSGLISRDDRPVRRIAILVGTALVTVAPVLPIAWNAFSVVIPQQVSAYPANCPIGTLGWMVLAGIAACFGMLLVEMQHYGRNAADNEANIDLANCQASTGGVTDRLMSGGFICLYVGLPMGLLVALRSLGDGNWGLAALLTMIATTKSADAGAYFTGKAIGKNKLIPRLSPGKTWEGAVGGVVASTLVAAGCLAFLFPRMVANPETTPPVVLALILGPALAVSGMIGDLAESLVKRDCDAKDSGNLLPGLGGVWDVTDSLIAAVLPAFLCFAAVA